MRSGRPAACALMDEPRFVFTLNSIELANIDVPGAAGAGLDFDQSYGTFTMGSRTQVFGLDANLGYHITVGQKGGNHATVFATVGKGF